MDQNAPAGLAEDTAESLAASGRLCEKWHGAAGGRLAYAFTPRFAPTCSFELMSGAAKLAKEAGAYIQAHIAETLGENERVRELFPNYGSYTELYEDAGMLGPRSILAHAIHMSDAEYRKLAETNTRIAHCPTSNLFLKSGRMPVERVEGAGCAYGLGTDVGAGTSMSVFAEMRHADYVQVDSSVPPEKAFWLATQGGARVMSMEGDVGSLDVGKFADFCVIDVAGIDPNYRLTDLAADEILSLLMYRGDGNAVEATYVAGKKLDVDAI
jgi:guanine deaminase